MTSKIIPIFVPHMGCPNDCVFCNQRSISGKHKFDLSKAIEEVNKYLNYFYDSKNIELAFYGGSFTAIDKKIQFELLKFARDLKLRKKIHKIRLSTRPDAINIEILNYLKKFSVDIIELGVQSLDKEVLNRSKRGHGPSSVRTSARLIKDSGFFLGLQQMVGLPSDNYRKSVKTAIEIIRLEPDFVRIYPTLVIKNTELEELYLSGNYRALELEEATKIASDLLILYEAKKIEVIRVGLQSSENLQLGKDVVAGPIHDAFGELAYSLMLYKLIEGIELNFKPSMIVSSNRINSLLVGQKSIYKKKYMELFNSRIRFIGGGEEDIISFKSEENTVEINLLELKKEKEKEIKNVFKEH